MFEAALLRRCQPAPQPREGETPAGAAANAGSAVLLRERAAELTHEHPNSELTAFVKQAMMEHGAVNRLLSQHKLRGVCQIDRPYLDAAI